MTTSVTILLIVWLTNRVISQPDLCRNAKVDSITYIDDKKLWFFTSGGYYWLLKPEHFPPTAKNSKGKLPNGFQRGDAAVYWDTLNHCSKSQSPTKPHERVVVLVEYINGKNQYMEFDVRSPENKWSEPKDITNYHFIGRIKVNNLQ